MTQTTPELNSTEQLYTKLKKFHEVYLKLMEKLNLCEDRAYYGNVELKDLLNKLDSNDGKSVKSAIQFLKNSMINSDMGPDVWNKIKEK